MGRGFHTTPVDFGTAAWSFGAQVAEVEVDPDTGEVDVKHIWVAHDCGRAINPLAIEGPDRWAGVFRDEPGPL